MYSILALIETNSDKCFDLDDEARHFLIRHQTLSYLKHAVMKQRQQLDIIWVGQAAKHEEAG